MSKDPMAMSRLIKRYYQAWLVGPKLFSHPSEETKFYQFVKACIRYGANSRLNAHWLRQHLERDLPTIFKDSEYIEGEIRKAISLFDALRDFHKTRFPNRDTESRSY